MDLISLLYVYVQHKPRNKVTTSLCTSVKERVRVNNTTDTCGTKGIAHLCLRAYVAKPGIGFARRADNVEVHRS